MQNMDIGHRMNLLFLFIFLISPVAVMLVAAQSPDSTDYYSIDVSAETTTPSMGILVGILFCAFILAGFLSIYLRWCAADDPASNGGSFLPIVFVQGRGAAAPVVMGVDKSVMDRLPTFVYSAVKQLKSGEGPLECAICLNEFQDDEVLRLLPECNHVFHRVCIDAWLSTRTTCPVCRSSVLVLESGELDGGKEEADSTDLASRTVVEIPRLVQEEPYLVQIITVDAGENRASEGEKSRNEQVDDRLFFSTNLTGHSPIHSERFTLRLPEDMIRNLVPVSPKLKRTASLPPQSSSRSGYR
ncbi:hypothetical protein Dimus_017775 [Dionaea muscipula]